MTLKDDCEQCLRPWRAYPWAYLRAHCLAALTVFIPMENNNNFKKLMAFLLFLFWAGLTFGWFWAETSVEPHMWTMLSLTALVFAIFGKLWGIETDRIFFQRRDDE